MNDLALPMIVGIGGLVIVVYYFLVLASLSLADTLLKKIPRAVDAPAVPQPPFNRACGIAAALVVGDGLIALAIAILLSMFGPKDSPTLTSLIRLACEVPLMLIVGAIIFVEMLPTTYAKAAALRLIQLSVLIVVAGTLGIIAAIALN